MNMMKIILKKLNEQRINSYACILLFLSLGLLTACQEEIVRQDVIDKMENVVNESISGNANQASVPESVADSLIPTIDLDASAVPKIEDEARFDISVNAVAADQFFLSLVDGTDYNMVIHPEVSGSITLNLRNVTIPDVLEAARDVYDCLSSSPQEGSMFEYFLLFLTIPRQSTHPFELRSES